MDTSERKTERNSETNRQVEKAADSQTRTGAGERATERKPVRIVIRTPANRFEIPLEEIPEDMTYGWKVKYVRGALAREKIIEWKQNGWTEVPAGRHPDFTLAPKDSTEEIERGGLVLCEQPKEITKVAKEMDRQAAIDQVQTQLDRLEGRARDTKSERVTTYKKNYVPVSEDI